MPSELDAQFEAQRKEYGTYVAVETIYYDGARAFNVGDPVPASSVDGDGWVDKAQVAKVGTKAADAVTPTTDTTPSGS